VKFTWSFIIKRFYSVVKVINNIFINTFNNFKLLIPYYNKLIGFTLFKVNSCNIIIGFNNNFRIYVIYIRDD
jgi:hypothetical protein